MRGRRTQAAVLAGLFMVFALLLAFHRHGAAPLPPDGAGAAEAGALLLAGGDAPAGGNRAPADAHAVCLLCDLMHAPALPAPPPAAGALTPPVSGAVAPFGVPARPAAGRAARSGPARAPPAFIALG